VALLKVKLLREQECIAGLILQALSALNSEIYLVRCGERQKDWPKSPDEA